MKVRDRIVSWATLLCFVAGAALGLIRPDWAQRIAFIGTAYVTALKYLALPALILLGYIYFRMLSRNVYKRQEENSRYLRAKYKVQSKLRLVKERWKQRRDYKFFVCPACHTTLRVPKGRGKIRIVCRKCGNSFTGKS